MPGTLITYCSIKQYISPLEGIPLFLEGRTMRKILRFRIKSFTLKGEKDKTEIAFNKAGQDYRGFAL